MGTQKEGVEFEGYLNMTKLEVGTTFYVVGGGVQCVKTTADKKDSIICSCKITVDFYPKECLIGILTDE